DPRMEQRLAALKGEISDAAAVQDVERPAVIVEIHVGAMGDVALVVGEVAEIAGRVADVGDRDVADRWPAMAHQPRHVERLAQAVHHRGPLIGFPGPPTPWDEVARMSRYPSLHCQAARPARP